MTVQQSVWYLETSILRKLIEWKIFERLEFQLVIRMSGKKPIKKLDLNVEIKESFEIASAVYTICSEMDLK